MGGQSGYSDSMPSVTPLNHTVSLLLEGSISVATKRAYQRAWQHFLQYLKDKSITFQFPVPVPCLADFVGHLFESEYAPGTIMSMLSALSFVHKLVEKVDPTESFLIKKLLMGSRKLRQQKDVRLPITTGILSKIINASRDIFQEKFNQKRFIAMCSLAFHALLRVGEMTSSHNNLTIDCIQVELGSLTLQFLKYKHSVGLPSTHQIKASPLTIHCPVRCMQDYLFLRGFRPGALFLTKDGSAVSRKLFVEELNAAFSLAGIQNQRYTTHSFRIGGASYMATHGYSDAQSRKAGRWASNAFLSYIRINP